MVYLGTLLSFLYFKSGIIDPWFNLFIFLSIHQFYFLTKEDSTNKIKHAAIAGLYIGLAILTKGPVALLILILSSIVFVCTHRFKIFITWKELLAFILIAFVVCFAWFGIDLIKNGPTFIIGFIQRQIAIFSTSDADHGEPFFYHWWVLLIGCFPASVFFMRGMFTPTENNQQRIFKQWMLILFWVTLLLFSIVKTKIVHYSSLCWFPLTFLAALAIQETWNKKKLNGWLTILLGIIGFALSFVIAAIPFVLMNKDKWINKVDDVFARGNLEAIVHWTWLDGVGGLLMLSGVLFFLISKSRKAKTIFLFASVTVCCLLTAVLITPKIEAISQRANVEFFEARKGEDCYSDVLGYKSYVPFFYAEKQPFKNDSTKTAEWLLHGRIDKPAYISIKIQDKATMDTVPGMLFLYQKNGFVFYKRIPTQ